MRHLPARSANQRITRPGPHVSGLLPTGLTPALHDLGRSLHRALGRIELAVLAAVVVLFNLPLLTGTFSTAFIFHPAAVRAGEWWRLFTHPFIHVSWYHLLLDATVFFLVYAELREHRFIERLLLMIAAGAGSLVTAVLFSPAVQTQGLCGLSGIAHGLTAVVSLEIIRRETDRLLRAGALAGFIVVVGKSVLEAISGHVVFESWHLGSLGTPIAVCHAGGVQGGLLAWYCLFPRKQLGEDEAKDPTSI